jgi:hypothetical protein
VVPAIEPARAIEVAEPDSMCCAVGVAVATGGAGASSSFVHEFRNREAEKINSVRILIFIIKND